MSEDTNVAKEKIASVIDRVENLQIDREVINEDIRQVFKEAKDVGLDPKILRKLIALRKMDADDRREQAALLESYAAALQMDLF